jgi:hypothetical protein
MATTGRRWVLAANQHLCAFSAFAAVKAVCRCHSALRIPHPTLHVAFSQQVIHTAHAHASMSNSVKFRSESIKRRQVSIKNDQKRARFVLPILTF